MRILNENNKSVIEGLCVFEPNVLASVEYISYLYILICFSSYKSAYSWYFVAKSTFEVCIKAIKTNNLTIQKCTFGRHFCNNIWVGNVELYAFRFFSVIHQYNRYFLAYITCAVFKTTQ